MRASFEVLGRLAASNGEIGDGAQENVVMGEKRLRFWRPRFTLATMLVLITIVAIPLSYVAQRRAWNLRRKAAYEVLQREHCILVESWPVSNISIKANVDPSISEANLKEITGLSWSFQGWWNDLCLEYVAPKVTAIQSTTFPADPQHAGEADIRHFGCFPELEELRIGGSKSLTDRGLSVVGALPHLRLVFLSSAPNVRGEFLGTLSGAKDLESLKLYDLPKLQGEHLPDLTNFAKFKELDIHDCELFGNTLRQEVHLPPSTEKLKVWNCSLSDEILSRWLAEVRLKELSLNSPLSRKIAPSLANQTELELLSIQDAPLEDDDLVFLSKCDSLRSLELEAMPIHGAFLEKLPKPQLLEELSLDSTLLQDKNLAAISRFTNLQSLNLNWTPISGEGFGKHCQWQHMAQLSAIGTQFSDEGKTSLVAIVGPRVVMMPANWTAADHKRFGNAGAPFESETLEDSLVDPRFRDLLSYSPLSETSARGRTSEKMAPVLRLYEIVHEKVKKWDEKNKAE